MSANSVSSTREGREGAGAGLGVVWNRKFMKEERWLLI